MGVSQKAGEKKKKNRGETPNMDGENHGKPYFYIHDLGCFPPIFGNTLFFCGGNDHPRKEFFGVSSRPPRP